MAPRQVGFGVAVRGSRGLNEATAHLLALARTRKQALGGVQGQLVEGEDLAPSLKDAALGVGAHVKCTLLQLGHLLDTHFIHHSPYSHRGFALSPGSFIFRIMEKGKVTEVAGW